VNRAQSGKPMLYSEQRKLRLAYFVTHPIQYQAPMLRRIAAEPDIDLQVFFSSDLSVRGYIDQGFGVRVEWDTPLLEGYKAEFLPLLHEAMEGSALGSVGPLNRGIGKRLRDGQFDAVWLHGYHYLTNLQAIRAAHALRIPTLLRTDSTLHDRSRSRLKLAVKQTFFNWLKPRVSAVLSVGEENTAYWKHHFGAEFPIFRCVYAVDNDFFQRECAAASKIREQFRASLGLDPGRPILLFAAKLIARKRCGDLLEAYLRLTQADHGHPYLLIVGDGEERPNLEALAAQAHPGDVRFLGFRNQSELPRFYDLCTAFVLASVDEPWGLSINEVMNAGRPVIVSDEVGCQRDLVHPGINGYVIPAGDTEALTESLRSVLADEHGSRAMGAASLRIIADYSFEQNVAGVRRALHALACGFPEEPGSLTYCAF